MPFIEVELINTIVKDKFNLFSIKLTDYESNRNHDFIIGLSCLLLFKLFKVMNAYGFKKTFIPLSINK